MRETAIETMEEQKKKKWGIHKLVSGTEIVCNPIYTGPQRKDLVLDVDEHNKVITRLLTRPKGDPVSPLPEKCEEISWVQPRKTERQWMDLKALRVLQTFLIYAGYFMLAVMLLLYSSTIRDVKEVTGKDASHSARYLYPTISISAAVIGALSASLLVNKINRSLLLSVAMFVMATTSLILPFCAEISVMSTALALMGLGMGLFDAGGNISLVKMWGADHESWLQALHFIYALGLLLAHWLLEPFFKYKFHGDQTHPAVKYEDLPNKEYLFVIGEVSISKSSKHINVDVEETLVQSQGYDRERVDNIGTVKAANFAVDNEFVLASIPTFLIGFGFLILAFYTFLRKKTEKVNFVNEEVEKLKEEDGQREYDEKVPSFVLVFLSFLLLAFFSAFCWLQFSMGEYLFAFSFHVLNFTAGHAKIVSLVYYGALVLGTFLGIFVIKFLRAKTFTSISLVLLAINILPWCFAARCHGLVWLLASLFGLSTSAIFSTVVSWAFEHFSLSGVVGSTIMVARTIGLMLGPITIEVVLKHFGIRAFLQVTAGITVALTLLFIMMHFTAHKYGTNKTNKITLDVSPRPLKNDDEGRTMWLHEASFAKQ